MAASDLTVTLLLDMREERWPSMDLVGESLHAALLNTAGVRVQAVCPLMRRRFSGEQAFSGRGYMADRLLSRHWDYPRHVRGISRGAPDVYHVIDHSYAQLVHALPAHRTIVSCHDLDAFRSILEPHRESRSWPYRAMMQRVLRGLQSAAHVVCGSATVHAELLAAGVVTPDRTSVVPYGVSAEYTPDADVCTDSQVATLLDTHGDTGPLLLHVGSTIARKRIDDLLTLFSVVRQREPSARLVRVGGALTPPQAALAQRLGIQDAVITLPFLTRAALAAVYRRATVVLLPSSAEGFGLPVVEALACGAPVIASDLPVLREVGGAACTYRPVGDINAWATGVLASIHAPAAVRDAGRIAAVAHAAQYRWETTAEQLLARYQAVRDAA